MPRPLTKTARIDWRRPALLCLLAACCLAAAVGAMAGETTPAGIQQVLEDAHAKFEGVRDGANADYIPALDKVDPELFGISLVTPDGRVYSVGDDDYTFSIQSISKAFVAAAVIEEQGIDAMLEKIGVGGGIVAVAPGRYGIAAFSPRLDAAGNSVRAQLAIDYIAERLGGNIFE